MQYVAISSVKSDILACRNQVAGALGALGLAALGDALLGDDAQIDRWWAWVDDDTTSTSATSSLLSTLNQMDVAWQQRDRDNVIIKHYADYKRDLEGEMRDLARQSARGHRQRDQAPGRHERRQHEQRNADPPARSLAEHATVGLTSRRESCGSAQLSTSLRERREVASTVHAPPTGRKGGPV